MTREHKIIAALGPTAVPVPDALGSCVDAEVNGAPFYVMSFVDGVIVRDVNAGRALTTEATRERMGRSLVDVLADLHAVDPDESVSVISGARRATSSVSSSGGRRSSRRPEIAICPSSTRCTAGSPRPSPSRAPRRSLTATTDWTTASVSPDGPARRSPRLGALHARRPDGRPRRCSSSVGPRTATAVPRVPTRRRSFPASPPVQRSSSSMRTRTQPRRQQPLVLLRVPVLATRLHLRRCLRALRRRRDG